MCSWCALQILLVCSLRNATVTTNFLIFTPTNSFKCSCHSPKPSIANPSILQSSNPFCLIISDRSFYLYQAPTLQYGQPYHLYSQSLWHHLLQLILLSLSSSQLRKQLKIHLQLNSYSPYLIILTISLYIDPTWLLFFIWFALVRRWNYKTRVGIQLSLKRLPDSSVSSLIRAGWRQEGHPVTKNLFQHSQG